MGSFRIEAEEQRAQQWVEIGHVRARECDDKALPETCKQPDSQGFHTRRAGEP